MLLPSGCLFVLVFVMLLGGSSADGTNSESKLLHKWKSSSDAEEGKRDMVKEHGDKNIADMHVRIERAAGYSKKNKLKRQKSKKHLKRQHMKKDSGHQIKHLLKVKSPLDYHKLIDLLNAGVRQSQHQALNTKIQSTSLVNDARESYKNKTSQKMNNHNDVTVLPDSNQAYNRHSKSKTNLPPPGPSVTSPKPTPTEDVTPIIQNQTTTYEHDNQYSTSRTYLQSSTPGLSDNPLERTSTGDTAQTIGAQTTTQEQKNEASHTDTVIKPLYSNVSAVGEQIRNNVLFATVHTSLQRSKPSIQQVDPQLGAAVSQNCNNTLDIQTCMSSFSLRGLFSLRNATTVNPRKGQETQVDTLKSRQVIMLTNMFNKSLSQTWKLLIPHPKLETVLKSQTKSEGVFETQKDEEALRISSASPQWLLTKLKKKKTKAYTKSDHRPSAIGIGSVGALVLVTIVVGIIILDSRSLYRDIRRLKRGIYNLCKPVYKHKLTISKRNQKGEKWAYVIRERQV